MEITKWLESWYLSYVDGHATPDININTVSNPGWYLVIDLTNTPLAAVEFDSDLIEIADDDWYFFTFQNAKYTASGDVRKLGFLLQKFKDIAEKGPHSRDIDERIKWLESWYQSQCDGDWEHSYGIKISAADDSGWSIEIDLTETELENVVIENEIRKYDEKNWWSFSVKSSVFIASGDPNKLRLLLDIFSEIARGGMHKSS